MPDPTLPTADARPPAGHCPVCDEQVPDLAAHQRQHVQADDLAGRTRAAAVDGARGLLGVDLDDIPADAQACWARMAHPILAELVKHTVDAAGHTCNPRMPATSDPLAAACSYGYEAASVLDDLAEWIDLLPAQDQRAVRAAVSVASRAATFVVDDLERQASRRQPGAGR